MASTVSALKAGASLINTSVWEISKQINSNRNVTIQISNYSNTYILVKPRVYNNSGYCLNPPQPTVQMMTSEAYSFTKTSGTACGAVGVLTYEIQNHKNSEQVGELVIMFSVPYNYNHYDNWFALGIYNYAVTCDYQLYRQMYYGEGPFTRDKATGSEIQFKGEHVDVKGTMSPAGKSILTVELWDAEKK